MKKVIKFQLSDVKNSVLIFYMVMILVLGLFFAAAYLRFNDTYGYSQFGGIGLISLVFLFVVGLNSFKEPFYLFLQNGISRKTMIKGQIVSGALIALVITCFGRILEWIGGLLAGLGKNIYVVPMLEQIYGKQKPGILTDFVMMFLFCLMFYSVGYFLTLLYYRMNKALKIIVSISFYAVPFIIIPWLDYLSNGQLSSVGKNLISLIMGFGWSGELGRVQLFMPVLTFLLISAIAWGFSFLLIRKAMIKKQ